MAGQHNASRPEVQTKRVIVLGNCVAERLQFLLNEYPGFQDSFVLVPTPAIHTLSGRGQWEEIAQKALACDVVLSQPLFRFGPCNTETLRASLQSANREIRLVLFSSPHFDAYFPDIIFLQNKKNLRLQPVLDWDSSIIFSCFCQGVPLREVEAIYCNHPLFHASLMNRSITAAIEHYLSRESGLDISTRHVTLQNYTREKLFHSPKHPIDSFLCVMLHDMAECLGLSRSTLPPAVEGFGFNQWPVITRHHSRFSFAEQAYFVLAGKKYSIEDISAAYYRLYEHNPHVVKENLDKLIAV